MGTAPDPRQHPAMPSPQRVVRRSLTMLRSLGYPDVVGLVFVRLTAQAARDQLAQAGFTDLEWLDQVASIATDRLGGFSASQTEQEKTDHGNGTGRPAGGPAGQ